MKKLFLSTIVIAFALAIAFTVLLTLAGCDPSPRSTPPPAVVIVDNTTAAPDMRTAIMEHTEVTFIRAYWSEAYTGEKAIAVEYEFINVDDEDGSCFTIDIYDKAFQDGVQLDRAVISGLEDNSMREIKPGGKVVVTTAYKAASDTSDILLELDNAFSMEDDMVSRTIKATDVK